MEHSLPLTKAAAVQPWRTAALVAAAIAVVELVLLIVAATALLARPLSHHARKAAVASAQAQPHARSKPAKPLQGGPPSLSRRHTAVVVLNGNGRTGAAATEASRVRARGYRIRRVGNAPRMTYSHSLVMYKRGFRPEALRLARDLRIGIVSPLDGLQRRDLRRAQLAVVVGE